MFAIVPLPLANIFVMSGNFSRVCHDNCNCFTVLLFYSFAGLLFYCFYSLYLFLPLLLLATVSFQLVSSWPATHLLFTLPKTIYLAITRNCRCQLLCCAGRGPHSMETCRKFINSPPKPKKPRTYTHFPATQL